MPAILAVDILTKRLQCIELQCNTYASVFATLISRINFLVANMSGKAIRINLDQSPRRLWHPGDTVTGNVILEATDQVDVDKIDIVFEGRVKTKARRSRGNNSSSTYRGLVILFRYSRDVFEGPFTLKPGSMQWPFEFQIPETPVGRFRSIAGDQFNYPRFPLAQFSDDPWQPLPPSMDSYNTGFGDSCECYISYKLTANLHVTSTWHTGRSFVSNLQLQPYRQEAQPEISYSRSPQRFHIRTMHLIPEATERSLNFKERMKTAFQPSKVPLSVFSVAIDLPRSAIIGQPMKVLLHLSHLLNESTAPELPMVYLKKFALTLQQRTSTMVKASHLFGEDDDLDTWNNKRQVVSWSGSVPITESLDVGTVLPRPILTPNFVPSFKTFSVAVEYHLLAEYSIECAQQRESSRASVREFMLFAADYLDQAPTMQSAADGIAPRKDAEDEPLPAYSR